MTRLTARVPTTPETRDRLADYRDDLGAERYEDALQRLLDDESDPTA